MNPDELGGLLERVYAEQRDYNDRLKVRREFFSAEEWAQKYLLGLTGEVSEVLREIDWKIHRSGGTSSDSTSLALELADLQKYVLCLWQNFGFTEQDILFWVQQKTAVMNYRMDQELGDPISGKNVLVLDLDGVVADWRKGLMGWLLENGMIRSGAEDPERSLSMDIDMGWPYSQYSAWKTAFERAGGLAGLPVFRDNCQLVQAWRKADPLNRLVVTTARSTTVPRVWYDTFVWLSTNGILPDRLLFVADGRVAITLDLMARNREVVLMDDNPDIHLRTTHNELRMLVPQRGYNWAIVPDPPRVIKSQDLLSLWLKDPSILPGG